jgi:hypothetical protein
MKKKKPEFIIGKIYRRIPNPVASDTMLCDQMSGNKRVGEIKLGSTFIVLQKEGDDAAAWYKIMTSDGIIGWSPLHILYWKKIDYE